MLLQPPHKDHLAELQYLIKTKLLPAYQYAGRHIDLPDHLVLKQYDYELIHRLVFEQDKLPALLKAPNDTSN